jgi:hypothetical protein
MRVYAIALCGFYVFAKAYVRFWLFRPTYDRPSFARHVEALRCIDLAAMLALIAAFFILINSYDALRTCVLMAGLLVYDATLRYVCLQLEVRRLIASSSKWSYRGAVKQVRRRARGSLAR